MIDVPSVPYANPDVFAEGEVVSTGLSVPANNRVLCVMGEGARREVLVNFAAGGGEDGLDPTYTTSTGADGRHFLLSTAPVVPNRLQLLKNGIPLEVLEAAIDDNPFSNKFGARFEVTTGKIELQRSKIYNQGGDDYVPSSGNQGNGTIDNLTIVDTNAPQETWTIRCSSTLQDAYGNPIPGFARFTCFGSVTGSPVDGYGNQFIWQSDGYIRSNEILRFSISEGLIAFRKGDTFTIEVTSGVLKQGDSLIANYIAVLDINDPVYFTDMDHVMAKHGIASTTNTLSLGAQIAFNNGAPGVYCIECAPGIPRRVIYTLTESATGGSTLEDLSFPLPVGVVPDVNSDVKLFTISKTGVQTQILPNKVAFYNPDITSDPSSFVFGSEYVYSYTVVMEPGLIIEGEAGVIEPLTDTTYAYLSHATTVFNDDDVAATYRAVIFGSLVGNDSPANGFEVTDVVGGKLKIHRTSGNFASETVNPDLSWRVIDTDIAVQSATVLLTDDLALSEGMGLQGSVVDTKDATFYDAGWSNALTKLETVELDILVPLPTETISVIFQSALAHCLNMSRIKNRHERVLIIGAIQGLTPDNVTGQSLAAVEDLGVLEGIQGDDPLEILNGNIEDLANYSVSDAFAGTYRCIYMYPDQIVINISGTNTFMNGFYQAPALGGQLAATGNVAIPSTNKVLVGYSILSNRTYSVSVAENITRSGICLVEPVLGGGRIVWGKTTSQSGYPEEEEISIVFIRDKISKDSRAAMRGFIGQPESQTFASTLLTRVTSLLIGFVNQGLITKYANIVVSRDAVEPRQWNIRFQVQPTYPVNWIYIKFSIGTF